MPVKSEDFLFIEKCFSTIKAGIDVRLNLDKIERALNRVFGITAHIDIIENETKDYFGVNIFPTHKTLEDIVADATKINSKSEYASKTWFNNKEWFIEIDSMLINEIDLNANSGQIVSLILHELAFVAYRDKIPVRVFNLIRAHLVGMNYRMKALATEYKIRNLFHIVLLEACTSKNYKYEEHSNENSPNRFINSYGYRNDYESFIDKLISKMDNRLVNRTDEEMDKEIKSIINWCITNIIQLELRKHQLRDALQVEMLRTPSTYIRLMIQSIYRAFFGNVIDNYRVLLSEAYMETPKDVYSELQADQYLSNHVKRVLEATASSIWDKKGKLKKITQADIDILFVEAGSISTTDDKIYLLDKLYSHLELVNMGLDYINDSDKELSSRVTQSKSTLEDFKKQLNTIRDVILTTKIIDKQYGVFIKYPSQYQG